MTHSGIELEDILKPNLSNEAIEELKPNVKGEVVLPSDTDYDKVRAIWNAIIDERPAVMVQCGVADDVPVAIAFCPKTRSWPIESRKIL
ncbi:MAG: hypothetical protein O2968_07595 [Acidobacteria bacterium]|nr:hypothetical protein [Acidobacteriota bacterium]